MQETLNRIGADVKLIKELLTGNGDPQKGIIVRLDRVEVKVKRADWIVRTLFCITATGVLGLIGNLVLAAIKR